MNTETVPASTPDDQSKCALSGPDGPSDKVYSVQPQESCNAATSERGVETEKTGADLLAQWMRRRWSEPRIRTLLAERFPGHLLPTVHGSDFWILVAHLPLTKTPVFWRWIEAVPVRAQVKTWCGIPEDLVNAKTAIFKKRGWYLCNNTGVCSADCDRCGGLGWYRGDHDARNPDYGAAVTGECSTLIADTYPDGRRWRVVGTRHDGEYIGTVTGTLDQLEALLPWLATDLQIDMKKLLNELRRPVPPALVEATELADKIAKEEVHHAG